jgi:hypothetical protein
MKHKFIKFKFYLVLSFVFGFTITKAQISVMDSTSVQDNQQSDSIKTNFNIPIFSTSGADADSDMDQQDASALLQSSRDVFTQFSSFQFGAARYRMRGLQSENQIIMINGVVVNNSETGMASWSSWGGLNDVTRYVENRVGSTSSRLNFASINGYTNIDSKASSFKKGTRISYGFGNRIFRHRLMVTHSTGMMQNGWAFTISASTRQGNQVYVPGTHFNANAFYLSADKKINDKHLISLTAFAAPREQGRSSATYKEAMDLTNDHYYNSLWGYQNGKVRNSSISRVNRPMLMLSHIFNINTASKLTTSAFVTFGKSGLTALNWNDAPNPRPDYYKYLPSYFYNQKEDINGDLYTSLWQNDVNTQQINWDRIIAMNQANLYSTQLGQINTSETRARVILENRIENLFNTGVNVLYNTRINDQIFLTAGANANIYKNRRYKEMEDLLGATFWVDVDQFAENLGIDQTVQQSDIDNPNRKVYKGDKFGYDYTTNVNRAEVWSQVEYNTSKIDAYFGLTLNNSKVWREGHIANGKFPTTSKGNSEKLNFFNYGVKGGLTYKFNGRHFITVNGNYLTRAPEVTNVFISPRVRNDIVNGVKNETVMGGDINYLIKYPTLKLRATYYYNQINNQTQLRTYWHDVFNNNVNYILTGLNQTHQGVELGIEKTLFTSHVVQGAFGYGNFYYTNRPKAQAWQDNNSTQLFTDRTVYMQNYHIGGTPQAVAGIGYRYNDKKRWFVGVFGNYFANSFLEPNPDRRTQEALDKYITTDPQIDEITKQEKLPNYFIMNANAGKSFRVKKKYFINVNVSVNNLLNNKNIIIWGFESLRWDVNNINKFPNKYQYMQGTTYMATVNFSF